jgi:hypothetical protein
MPRLQTLVFTLAIFVSAFLLFLIQPLFAKMILPVLGGSSAVWTTCMLFFQASLLAGYFYAHLLTKYLPLRAQVGVHLVLTLLAFSLLPFHLPENLQVSQQPITWVLLLAAQTIGLPFLILSATAPLLQRWFSFTTHPHRANPYFLYAASNIGSMIALLSYPFGIEATFGLKQQQLAWVWGYATLGICVLSAALVALKQYAPATPETIAPSTATHKWAERFSWLILAAIPSSLMLGLTSYVTTDIAAISLFWIVPLALYLLTFIIVFGTGRHISLKTIGYVTFGLVLGFACYFIIADSANHLILIFCNTAFFFLVAWFFHGHLAATKPSTTRLTEFYLWMSLGGMVGGLFNAIVAPFLFMQAFEYIMVTILSISIMAGIVTQKEFTPAFLLVRATNRIGLAFGAVWVLDWISRKPVTDTVLWQFYAGVGVLFVLCLGLTIAKKMPRRELGMASALLLIVSIGIGQFKHDVLLRDRSFYGRLQVTTSVNKENQTIHSLAHGSTQHGLQIFEPVTLQNLPLSYYHQGGLFEEVIKGYVRGKEEPANFALIGLGTGALTAYAQQGDTLSIYEIDQKVVDIAQNPAYFTYLKNSPATQTILLGDARLKLKEAANQQYDALFIDAFSSDAIPVHLLTQEAIDLYLQKVKRTGVIAIHISNRYLDLSRVIANYRLPEGYDAYCGNSKDWTKHTSLHNAHILCIVALDATIPAAMKQGKTWKKLESNPDFTPWTDDFSNIFSVFHF